MSKIVVVTGAAGYIGGQTVLHLKNQGHTVIGVDRRPLPDHLLGTMDQFFEMDFADERFLTHLLVLEPSAIVHCGGTSLVGPSMMEPCEYYENNFVKTKKLLDFMVKKNLATKVKIVFSSSAAVYGDPVMVPCHEEDPPLPMSPYGESKLMVEMLLKSYHHAYGIKFVAFRYFNACGADSQGHHGQESGATHIIARVLESIKDNSTFTLNGSNYATPDGSCIRDYVHVEDIANAHGLAIDHESLNGVFNLGTSQGISNRQIISAAELVTGKKVNVVYGPERPGDPSQLTASAQKFNLATGWVPTWDLNEMISHAWNWYR